MLFEFPWWDDPDVNFISKLRLVVAGNPEPYIPEEVNWDGWEVYETVSTKVCDGPLMCHGTMCRLASVWSKELIHKAKLDSAKMGGKPGLQHFFQLDLGFHLPSTEKRYSFAHICGPMFTLTALPPTLEDGGGPRSPILTTNRDMDMGK